MPLRTPTLRQVIARTRSDLTSRIPTLDPTIVGSFARVLVESIAARVASLYSFVDQASRESFPQTATGQNLDRWADYDGLTRNASAGSSGSVVMTGTVGTIIPADSKLSSSSGQAYSTVQAVTLATQQSTISSLTRTGTTALAVSTGHDQATGQTVTISGATDVDYNGSFVITVIDEDNYSYQVANAPNTPTSGTILSSYDGGTADITSDGVGSVTNLDSGSQLSLTSPLAEVDNTARALFGGATGGSNDESDDLLRERVLLSRSSVRSNFSPDEISNLAREVPGVTRVLVARARPAAGSATVLFVRDGDANIIPSAADVTNVRTKLLSNLPANVAEAGLLVQAPVAVVTNFTFTAVTPNTATMKTAIENSLKAFFEDNAQIEQSITEDQYRSAITQTVDTETSQLLTAFTLSSPSADITISQGEIATLGTITFS